MQSTHGRNARYEGGAASPRRRAHSPRRNNTGGDRRHKRSGGFRAAGASLRPPRGTSRPARRGQKLPSFDPSQFINTNPVEAVAEAYEPRHAFGDFGLDRRIVDLIAAGGLASPSPIQDQVIPEILNDRDVIGLAETGTGKTAAFLLPLIHKTLHQSNRQTLILTPTRELAIQIEQELRKFSRGLHLYSTICVGGANIRPQIQGLRRRNHFIIGTPGRILDLIERGDLRTGRVTTVVLDEADRMLDMGFIKPIRDILAGVPAEREMLFFSATMDERMQALSADFLRHPAVISVKKKDVTNSIRQDIVRYERDKKFETLVTLLSSPDFKRVIIFGAMKHSVEKLAKELSGRRIVTESIHGNKNQSQRQRSLAAFKSGQARVLCATDVAARGIHVDQVSHVINYDLPNTFEDYVHRIGRTGRGHHRGEALTFIAA